MSLEHKVENIWQDLVKSVLCHLITAYFENLTPGRLLGILDPHIIYLALGYASLCALRIGTPREALTNRKLLIVVNSLDSFIHLADIRENFDNDAVEEFVEDLFHFLVTVIVEDQLSLIFVGHFQLLHNVVILGCFYQIKEQVDRKIFDFFHG